MYKRDISLFKPLIMKYLFVLVSFFAIVWHTNAQNGLIISNNLVIYPDSIIKQRVSKSPAFQLIFDETETHDITYLSTGLKIKGFVIQPKKPGKYPCLIFCRGGHEDFGSIDLWTTSALADIARHGYVVIASQLRGSPGSDGKDEFGGADTSDVINCIPALAHLPYADTSRIGIYGISRGGMNALQVLRSQKSIKAAIINSGLVNAFDNIERKDGAGFEKEIYQRLIPDYQTEKQKQLMLRSALYWPEMICKTTPLLIMQGTSDWRVDAAGTIKLAEKLYALKQPMRLVLVEGGTHGLRLPIRDNMLLEWLDRYVKNKTPLPDMTLHGE
ncbi:Prolyl oligopeptidase family protein [Mucilaginibacter polytrichastri]|nr:Prolyl oligopeptidase family protein [Mucilaginibacter polytrichastri]